MKYIGNISIPCIFVVSYHIISMKVLPQEFAENMITKLPNKVPLIGPSGATWDVTLMKTDKVAFVGDEWKRFGKAYGLEPSYLLMFKYKRNVGFQVLIFDPVTFFEKKDSYFVTKNDQQEKKGNSAEAFGTGTEQIVDDEINFVDSEFVTSKRVRRDTEDPTSMGETTKQQTPRKRASARAKRGGSHSRGRGRGRGKPRRARISGSHLKAKSVGTQKRNKTAKEQPVVVENQGSDVELGQSHEPRGAEKGNLEIAQSPKPNKTAVGMPERTKIGEEQLAVEKGENNQELGRSHDSDDTPRKRHIGNEGAEELISPANGEANLETVQSPEPNETTGKKTNGSKPVKELTSPENGGSIREIVYHLNFYQTRGKKLKESEAAKEQHGKNLEIVHPPKSIGVIGNTPYGIESSKEAIDPCKSSWTRCRSRKQSAPRKKNVVYENVLSGDKSNSNEAAKEQNGLDIGASALEMEMVCSDKTVKTRARRRRQI